MSRTSRPLLPRHSTTRRRRNPLAAWRAAERSLAPHCATVRCCVRAWRSGATPSHSSRGRTLRTQPHTALEWQSLHITAHTASCPRRTRTVRCCALLSAFPRCAAYGMCRIVPPAGWSPPFCLDSSRFKFGTRLQDIHALQSGRPFANNDTREYTLRQFQVRAETFKAALLKQVHAASPASTAATVGAERLEAAYWDVVCRCAPSPHSAPLHVQVEYGADLDSSVHGSGFESLQLRGDEVVNDSTELYAGSIGWNLRALPLLPGSLLGLLDEHVPGVCQYTHHDMYRPYRVPR